jgi:hypothetical protein
VSNRPRFVLALLFIFSVHRLEAADACAALIPTQLKQLIASKYPDSLLPFADQTDSDSLKYSVEHGGTGCLRVASADVDGDGRLDFAALLTSRKHPDQTRLVAFRYTARAWKAETLMEFSQSSAQLYVERCEPGTFRMSKSIEEISEPGERAKIVSRRPGFWSGVLESADIAFFYQHGRWVHVRVTD